MAENNNIKGSITSFNTYHTDAYMIAVKNGFKGTEAEWLASLKGPKGDTGEQGIQGVKGDKGEQGIQGVKGDKGEKGESGVPMVATRNLANLTFKDATFNDTSGNFKAPSNGINNAAAEEYIAVTGGENYTFSWALHPIYSMMYVYQYDADKAFIEYKAFANVDKYTKKTLTVGENCAYIRIRFYSFNTTQTWSDLVPDKLQIELGEEATEYIAPQAIDPSIIPKEENGEVSINMFPRELIGELGTYPVTFEQGVIGSAEGTEADSDIRVRTGYLPIGRGIVVKVPEGVEQSYFIRVYDADKTYLGYATLLSEGVVTNLYNDGANTLPLAGDDLIRVYPTAKYFRIVVQKKSLTTIRPEECALVFESFLANIGEKNEYDAPLDLVYERKKIGRPYKSTDEKDISVRYIIDMDGHYTNGLLKLPSNYKQTGDPVPLIVFCHGSGGYNSISATNMAEATNAYYNYLRDCGYAVFDCFGWGNKYGRLTEAVTSTYGTPTNNRCYIEGIKHVCKIYNIDQTKIYVTCKSLGGIQALALAYQNEIPIRAVGMLAPELDTFRAHPLGYTRLCRTLIAQDVGFTGDWQSVFDVADNAYDKDAAIAYLETQTDVLVKHDMMWRKVLLPNNTKFGITTHKVAYDNSAFRICDIPIKVWAAPDDNAILYTQCEYLVSTLKNGGCYAELRTMPEGTGGHHAVDNDENALKVDSITTRLGITHTNVPTAYVELIEFFEQF